MRKVLVLFAAMMLFGAAAAAQAETTGSAVARVSATVLPNISVGVVTGNVNAGSIQTGRLNAVVVFRIDANQQSVCIQVAASPLFKADDPRSPNVIALHTVLPVLVVPAQGNRAGGLPNSLAFDGPAHTVSGFPMISTFPGIFESSQAFVFSQEVTTTIPYNQADAELPQGEYSGVVQFTASLI